MRGRTKLSGCYRKNLSFLWDAATAARKGVCFMAQKLPDSGNNHVAGRPRVKLRVEKRKKAPFDFRMLIRLLELLSAFLGALHKLKSLLTGW